METPPPIKLKIEKRSKSKHKHHKRSTITTPTSPYRRRGATVDIPSMAMDQIPTPSKKKPKINKRVRAKTPVQNRYSRAERPVGFAPSIRPLFSTLKKTPVRFRELLDENEALKKEIQILRKQRDSTHTIQHTESFWRDIASKLINDTYYIKSLLRTGAMTVFDEMESNNRTLLLMAARYGNYEIAQLALNMGANIDHKDKDNLDALDHAKEQDQHHIVQLLTLNKMEANISKRVTETAYHINKQNGIIGTMIKHISYLKNKQSLIDTLTDIMIKIITNKEAFDDTMLCMVLQLHNNPTTSALYKTLISVSTEIINGNDKRNWFWFKNYVIPSKVWYTSNRYSDLLHIVNKKSIRLLLELDRNLKGSEQWGDLIEWEMKEANIKQPRQDEIMNGIKSKFSKTEILKEGGSSSSFNSMRHYDEKVYLSELIGLAHSVDASFQDSVQSVFVVDKIRNIGSVSVDDDEKDIDPHLNDVVYTRGPVKLVKRARAKADNDFNKQKYPTTACIVDLNRCSLVFESIRSLLRGIRLLENKVSHYKAGTIIGIIRAKNGFKEYLKNKQYADIKLNVIIKGKHQCIIGEIQFLLRTMMNYKKVAHNLYAIQREEQFIKSSTKKIFPILLDQQKMIKMAGVMGNAKQILHLMCTNNYSIKMILKQDEQKQTILTDICCQGHLKVFKMIKSMASISMFVEYLLDLVSTSNYSPLEMAIRRNRTNILKEIFEIKGVQTIFESNNDKVYRAMWWLFKSNTNTLGIIDILKSNLKITRKRWDELSYYPYKESKESLDSSSWIINGQKDGDMMRQIQANDAAKEALRRLDFPFTSTVD